MFKKLKLITSLALLAWANVTMAQITSLTTGGNWPTGTLGNDISVALTSYVSPSGTITIPNGKTLTITIDPTFASSHTMMYITDVRDGAYRSSIFDIRPGGKLIIRGTANCPLIIEGNGDQWGESYLHADGLLYPPTSELNKAYTAPAVRCDGELDFQYVIMQGIYNCSVGQAVSNLGTIRFGTTNSNYVSNLDHVTFKRNVGFCGPVIYIGGDTRGTVNMSNCSASQNEAHHISDGTSTVHNGGAIRTSGSSHMALNITNSTFDHNKSGGNGGAIYASSYNDGSMITLNGCEFSYNHSGLSGGGVLFEGNSSLQGTNRFHHNTALRNGGGISIEGYSQQTTGQAQTINFYLNSGLELDNNYSPCGAGLGINLRASVGYGVGSTINITVDGSNIHHNQASTDTGIGDAHLQGGGIYILNNLKAENNYTVNVNLNGCKIKDNIAGMGAGVFVVKANVIGDESGLEISDNKANVSSSNLIGGSAPENWNCGGGVVVQSGDLNLKNGVVKSNEALVNGGGAAVLGGSLEISGCQVGENGSSNKAVKGGGMFVKGGNFTINSGSIQYNNDATIQNGAGIYVQGGNAYVKGGSVSNNKSQVAGAGIYVEGGNIEVSGGSIESNQSPTDGAGIYLSDGTNPGSITISGGSIKSNTAANNGGGFYVGGGSATISGGTISGNYATNVNGGGFYVAKGNVSVTDGTISSNHADKGLGGGFYVNTGTVNVIEGTDKEIIIKQNQANQGGGFYAGGGDIQISGATIQSNIAIINGGGLYSAAPITIGTSEDGSGATVSGNQAKNGAGFYVKATSSATTTIQGGSTISGNIATENGAGAYIESGNLLVNSSTAKGNQANNGNGGGFYVGGGTLTLSGGTIGANGEANEATNGGGFYITGGEANISGGTVQYNKATNGGGFYMQGGESTISGGTVQYNEATNGGGLYMQGTDAENKATANFTDGYFQYNSASEAGGGIFLSSNSQLTMSGASRIISNTVSESNGTGGGIQIDGGEFIVVGGEAASLKVTGSTANGKANNVYLNGENDYITIDKDSGTLGSMEVGVSINGRHLPKKVVYCENYSILEQIEAMLHDNTIGSSLVDDAHRYEPKISSERPFERNFLYFEKVWPVGITDEKLEGFLNNGQAIKIIDTPEKLTMFMMLVNGYLDGVYHPGLEGVVTADLNMIGSLWIPIGATKEGVDHLFTGSFDGGGHTISNVVSAGLTNYYDYGLFGKTQDADIKNVIVSDCNFVSGQSKRMGALICEMRGGTVENCVASGRVVASGSETNDVNDPLYCVVGGLIGEAQPYTYTDDEGEHTEYPSIRNCMSTVEVEALPKPDEAMYPKSQKITAGGLVGMTSAGTVVRNCYAHTSIQHKCEKRDGAPGSDYDDNTDLERFVGGLVAINGGELTNCYVRFQDGMDLDMGEGSTNSSMFGMFAGNNTGSISYCYAPNEDLFGVSRTYINNGTPASNYGEYNNVTCPYTYASYLIDNQAKMSNETLYGTTESTTLLAKLNRWVEDNNPTTGDDIYSNWMRTKSSPINGDYPIMKYDNPTAPDYAVAGSKDGIMLEYGTSFNDILGRFNDYEEGTLFIYDKLMKESDTRDAADMESEIITVNNDENVKIYIDEDIPVLQSEDNVLKNVYTCQELKIPMESWHTISSSLADSPIGIEYGNTDPGVTNFDSSNPCDATIHGGDESMFLTGTPIENIDLYCFYEPYYHWLNLKRNQMSHWHMNNHTANIPYSGADNNENGEGCILIPGKGYLAASFEQPTLMLECGTLNNGEITIPVTVEAGTHNDGSFAYPNEGTELRGYNLLGNPYQSYLSFSAFANNENNKKLWNGTASYYVYDAENDQYLPGTTVTISRGSFAATGDINMHQGFFIVADNPGTATFDNTMRSDNPDGDVQFRGEAPAYPLVNLMVKDAKGTGDVAVVEFDRPEYKAAPKMKNIGADGKIYFRYNNADQALLFLDEPTDQLPVHFDCQDGGTYTLTWSTANADFGYLHLIDNLTGMDIDMLASDGYTFTANADDYKSRFKMVFAYTGIGENEDADTDAEHAEAFAFFSNGDLIVSGKGNLEVIDMTGHVLHSTRLTDAQSRFSVPQVATGIYIVRLDGKVQKIVVR